MKRGLNRREAALFGAPLFVLLAAWLGLNFDPHSLNIFATKRERQTCAVNLRVIWLAMQQYAQDYDKHFPPVPSANIPPNAVKDWKPGEQYGWAQAISPYLTSHNFIHCPAAPTPVSDDASQRGLTSYWLNGNLRGHSSKLTSNPIMAGEGDDGRDLSNADYVKFSLPIWPTGKPSPAVRHSGAATYLFADGHAVLLTPAEAQQQVGPQFAVR